jgi:hypothetical protein
MFLEVCTFRVNSAWYTEFFVISLSLLWTNFTDARFGFLKAVLINVQVFWDMMPCGLVRIAEISEYGTAYNFRAY